jgi:vitamin B12 transporter
MRLLIRTALTAALLLPRVLNAQHVQDTTRLQELVVTATGAPTPADEVVSSITVIEGEELRARGLRFVQDALREVPGAAVVQAGSYGGVSSVFLRGGESDYVKVLIDGVPVNQSGGAYNWANLTTDNVDRIEILRGPASVIYGSDAVTGVVQIFTRGGVAGFAAEGGAEAGTFGTVIGHAAGRGGSQRVTYSADVSRISTDGTLPFNNGYGNTGLSGTLRGSADARTDLALAVRFSDSRYHFPTDFSGFLGDSNQSTAEQAFSLGIDGTRRLSDRLELRLIAGGSRTDGELDDLPDNAGDTVGFGFASRRDSRGERGNLDLRVNAFPSSALTLTAGTQVEREMERQSGETTSNFGGIVTTTDVPFDRGRTTTSFYGQGLLDLPGGLALNLNARMDHNSEFGTFFTYRAGAVYRLPFRTRVRASVGRAFKAPTFCEQFCNAPFVVGDPAIRPERSTSWELGVEQDLVAGRLALWATYFDQRFRDMILYDGSAPPGDPTYVNGAAAQSSGVETGVRSELGSGIQASASYTYLMTKATDDRNMPSPTFASGERLIRRPLHSVELNLRARLLGRASLGGSFLYVGSRDDVDFAATPSQRVELPGYALVDLAGEVDILSPDARGRGLSATVRVENLFNEAYDQVVGFPGRPRGVFGGLRFEL